MPATTILICTPDAQSKMFADCYAAVCDTTRGLNCDVLIFDNRHNPQFSHAAEINRAIQTCQAPYFVTLDDDARVSGDWLPAMQEAALPDEGVVAVVACTVYTPTRMGDQAMWSRGWSCGPTGNVRNYKGDIGKGAAVPAACSCCWLLASGRNEIELSTDYKKYYFDPDYCLRQWDRGRQTVTIPHPVTHLGGGWQRHNNAHETLRQDRERFAQYWLASGRLESIKKRHADKWPEGIRWD